MGAEKTNEFEDTPAGWAKRLQMELAASTKELTVWHGQADEATRRYNEDRDDLDQQRLGLFHSDIEIQRCMLYGRMPGVDVTRRYADASDDVARVASEMLKRTLNSDIERESDGFASTLKSALMDWRLAGFGCVRARYEVEFEDGEETPAQTDDAGTEIAPAVPAQQVKSYEAAPIDYVHYGDVRWSPCRIWGEMRIIFYRAYMTRDGLVKRFGKIGEVVPLNAGKHKDDAKDDDSMGNDPWARAEVWEAWVKDSKEVFWFCEGFDQILDRKADPLGLDGFWPSPKPLASNLTTRRFVPVPDYIIARDLYDACDTLFRRISLLEDAVRVVGLFDKNAKGLEAMFSGSAENKLIPVDNWALVAEKGGVPGMISLFPLNEIIQAIDKLTQKLIEKQTLLQQVTGMADIMRGASMQSETATAQSIKARFASVRMQDMQDEFARFASDAQRIKSEIISKHFDPQTIVAASNIENTSDAELIGPAVQLIKDRHHEFRIVVKPEAISMTDYATLQQERVGALSALAQFIGTAGPPLAAIPGGQQLAMEAAQWLISGTKGSSGLEAAFDRVMAAAKQSAMQPKPPPPPDPKIQAAQIKGQGDLQKTQIESDARMKEIAAETHSGVIQEAAKAHFGIMSQEAKARVDAMTAVNKATGASP